MTDKKYLTRTETAALLNVTARTLERWRKNKTLPASKIGGRVLYQKETIEQACLSNSTFNSGGYKAAKLGLSLPISGKEQGDTSVLPWHSVNDLLPPFGLVVEVPHPLNGSYEASLFDNDYHAEPNGGKPRFLVNCPDKIIFCCPNLWRFKK